VSPLAIGLWVIGLIVIAVGYRRGKGPWTRYQALRAQDANVARYEAWRGGTRGDGDERTGASVAMELLRRQARDGAVIALVGLVLVFAGFLID
jgi:hypothetical protein